MRYLFIILIAFMDLICCSGQNFPEQMPREIILPSIDVHPQKEHYSKRNNPAVDMMKLLKQLSLQDSPYNNDYYTYRHYEHTTIGLDNVNDSIGGNGKFHFLKQFVDSATISGATVLPLSSKEKLSKHYYRKSPKSVKELVYAIRSEGLDEIFDQSNVMTLVENLFKEIDFTDNDITLLDNRFVSPLSNIGPDFYKYYIGDTIKNEDGSETLTLNFVPRNDASFGFYGTIYAEKSGDDIMIKQVVMKLPREANVNFVESLELDQQFSRAVNGSRLKTADILTMRLRVFPDTQGVYVQRYTRYDGHDFSPPSPDDILDRLGDRFMTADAWLHDDLYWEKNRLGIVPNPDKQVSSMMAHLRGVGTYRLAERFASVLVSGYIPTSHHSKFDVGPINTLISFNDVEGTRLRLGGMTTAALNSHWFFRGYGAYGSRDHRWKYSAEAEYSFIPKKKHSREFPMNSIRATYTYDTDAPGQHFQFTNPDNLFLSLRRAKDTLMIYNRLAELKYIREWENNFSVNVAVYTNRQYATRYLNFSRVENREVIAGPGHIDFTGFKIELRYAPGEKFFQARSYRIPMNSDAPEIKISHQFSPMGLVGNRCCVNRTDIGFRKRFWLSAFGYIDLLAEGAHVWSRVPYTQLIIPNANLSYVIQPESFALLNPMEFILDSYAMLNFTYWANGALLNVVPGLKKLRLREVVNISGFWGHLSKKNNPSVDKNLPIFPGSTQPIFNTPYIELSAGLDNIFRIFRFDYVWRLTYRHNPDISTNGPRVALHLTF